MLVTNSALFPCIPMKMHLFTFILFQVTITSVTIRNRLYAYGERLQNLEVRAGTKNDNTNEIVGRFIGPGITGAKHVVRFINPVVANFLTFTLKKEDAVLQINGIYLNEESAQGKYTFFYRQLGCLA